MAWSSSGSTLGGADRGRGPAARPSRCSRAPRSTRTRVERVQGSTDVENAAMRRVLELLGFREDGVMRGFMPSLDGGRRAD